MNIVANLLDESNNTLITNTTLVRGCSITYKFNSYPTCDLYITSDDPKLMKYKNLIFDLKYEDFHFHSKLGVVNYSNKVNKQMTIQTILGDRSLINDDGSSYLGTDPVSAINSLGFDQEVHVHKTPSEYYQINETPINALHRILLGNKEKSIYFITEKDIKVIELNSIPGYPNPKVIGIIPQEVQYDNLVSLDDEVIKSTIGISTIVSSKNEELISSTLGGVTFVHQANSDYESNIISNLQFSDGLNLSIPFISDHLIDISVGDICKVPNLDFNIKNYIVTELSYVFIDFHFLTKFVLQSQEEII